MSRQMRKLSKSSIYHVMIRGNERKNVFPDDEDKTRFIDSNAVTTEGRDINFLFARVVEYMISFYR